MKKIVLLLTICLLSKNLVAYGFGKNKIQTEKINWKKIETLHFDIYYPEGSDEFAKIATLLTEEAYYNIKEDLKKPVKNRIPMIFYSSHQDFATTNVISVLLNESVGGFTESGKNRIAIPFDGSYKKLEQIITHELTHAYINELSSNINNLFTLHSLPFWFSEGFPEYKAVGGSDVQNNLVVIDKLLNDGWGKLEEIFGYYAYRLGESFLVYIEEVYGREKVMDLFYALRFQSTSKLAFKKVFGKEFEIIQKNWINFLKKKYYSQYAKFEVPYEILERKTDHKKDGSHINYAPSISPDGSTFLYFSDKNLRTDIYKGSTLDLFENKKIINGESTGKYEEFHFQNNNISWYPKGDKFAFVSKTTEGDKIYVIDSKTNKVLNRFQFPNFDAIYEIDIANSSDKIAFGGQRNFQTDIFVFDIKDGSIKQITNDKYYDSQPRWSNDDSKIAFTSQRTINQKNEHLLDKLTEDIYYYDLSSKQFYKITNDKDRNNSHPIWVNEKILFSTERDFTLNYDVVDLNSSKRAEVTNILGGSYTADITEDGSEMLLSVYYESGWDVYLKSNPLDNLVYKAYIKPEKVTFVDDLTKILPIEEYKKYGRRKRDFKRELPEYPADISQLDPFDYAKVDSSRKEYNLKIDKKPQKIKLPKISDYKTKFTLDYLWGGAAYTPSIGTYAQVQIGLSDLMGNHLIGANVGITGNLEQSDFILNYLNLAHRIDYGIGGFSLYDETVYRIYYTNEIDNDYFRERNKEYGVYSMIRYPFNKFWRIDLESVFTKKNTYHDWWNGEDWIEEYLEEDFATEYNLKTKEDEYIFSPQIRFVHDNVVFGNVGPLAGWRANLMFNRSFSSEKDFSVIYGDIRKYHFFAKKYSVALRLFGGAISGGTNSEFSLDYFSGVRGFDEDLTGKKKLISSFELRFPFIDKLTTTFPLPLRFQSIRGSAFLDAGCIWDENEKLKLVKRTKFKDLKVGIGFGPRINLGYFVLKLDIAWNTNLREISRPSYYFSLTPDF